MIEDKEKKDFPVKTGRLLNLNVVVVKMLVSQPGKEVKSFSPTPTSSPRDLHNLASNVKGMNMKKSKRTEKNESKAKQSKTI